MDGMEHDRQVWKLTNIEWQKKNGWYTQEVCSLCNGETPDVAWQLVYRGDVRYMESRWIYICNLCDGESRKLAPYWWNKALRGESLEDEDE